MLRDMRDDLLRKKNDQSASGRRECVGISIKKEKTRGRIIVEGKWWLLGDTREPPKKPPGIFHVELRRIGGHYGGKKNSKAVRSKESRYAKNLQASLHAYNMYQYGVL